jgi:GTP-binding protein
MTFTVAIIGRPNVGKSTLFNRLVGKRLAIVDDTPGVTRDRREGEGRLFDLNFRVIDTAGLEEGEEGSLEAGMRAQTDIALDEADVVMMLIDARAGITPLDNHFADWLRRQGKPVLLLANKCEGRAGMNGLAEAYGLGLGDPIPVSAAHGEGMDLLIEALIPFDDEFAVEEENDEKALQLAILGRPNAGKSTLVNRLLGENRMLTGPEPGVTRDSIASDWEWEGRRIRLIDTAGLRRRAKITDKLEKLSASDAIRALDYAQVVVLLIDALIPLEKQDLTIARRVVEEGRVLVIAANKWDLVRNPDAAMRQIRERVEDGLSQAKGVYVVTMSALTGRGTEKLLPAVFEAYDRWQIRISTAALNDWLHEMVERHPPPLGHNGRRLRLRYITQVSARPPTFAIFANLPDDVPDSYVRYIQNGLRSTFKLEGVPIRINLRKRKNPYAPKK